MARTILTVTCGALLLTGTALAVPTTQQLCDYQRLTAWKKFYGCMETVLAKNAKFIIFNRFDPTVDEFAARAKCRHAYFRKWDGFQAKASLAGSTCIGSRFIDNGDQTVTDNLTMLVWEKKTNGDNVSNDADPHDADNGENWGGPNENGTAFTVFLSALNSGAGFADSNGWRLPTLAELQSIILNFSCHGSGQTPGCRCPTSPCVDPALDAGNTAPLPHWSETSDLTDHPFQQYAWRVSFLDGSTDSDQKGSGGNVRAVHGGL